jgi:hypothetical protein
MTIIRQGERVILISNHAVERLTTRLRWPFSLYKDAFKNICFEYWDKLWKLKPDKFFIVKWGVKWIFTFENENMIVLKTVHHYNKGNEIHRELASLMNSYSKERSFLQKNKIKKRIVTLSQQEGNCVFARIGRDIKRVS